MDLAIMGTGNVAQTLARGWAAAAHDITFGSRDPGSKALDFPVRGLAEAVSAALLQARRPPDYNILLVH